MIGCIGKKKMISRLIDGDVSSQERQETMTHINSCAHCASVYDGYRKISQISDAFYSDIQIECPAKRIIHRVMSGQQRKLFAVSTVVPLGTFAAVCLLVIWLMFGNQLVGHRTVPSLVIDNSSTIMDFPLGTLTYYESNDGATLQSQFVNLSSDLSENVSRYEVTQLDYPMYVSPIFDDNDWTEYGIQ